MTLFVCFVVVVLVAVALWIIWTGSKNRGYQRYPGGSVGIQSSSTRYDRSRSTDSAAWAAADVSASSYDSGSYYSGGDYGGGDCGGGGDGGGGCGD
jgi:hypothetical protein